jgi:hypothetical protein
MVFILTIQKAPLSVREGLGGEGRDGFVRYCENKIRCTVIDAPDKVYVRDRDELAVCAGAASASVAASAAETPAPISSASEESSIRSGRVVSASAAPAANT